MKKIFYLFIISTLMSACDVDVDNPNTLTTATYWKTETDAANGVNAIYNMFYKPGTYSRWIWFRLDLTSDEGGSSSPWAELKEWTQFKYNNYNFWEGNACSSKEDPQKNIETRYKNPVLNFSLPDPTIIRADDKSFYLYATEDIRNLPIYKSTDLINWKFVGTAFTDNTRPNFEPDGGIWAPDINKINGLYVMYYSMSVWGGEWTCGIGIATANTPDGPFTDRGMLLRSNTINVQNSIDPFYIEDGGRKYLFWGSFHGKKGIVYKQRAAVCLETQKYPDSPNKPKWPSAILKPGEKYFSHCIFKFSTNK